MNANGKELFCVTSYFLNYKTEDSAASTRYKENGKAKVIGGYVTSTLKSRLLAHFV